MNDTQARSGDEAVIRSTVDVNTGPLRKETQRWVLAACVLGSSMAFIDGSVVNVALPKMESELETTLAYMTWVINAYTLCMSALLLIGGAAADQIGRRRIFMIGISIFSIASIGCGIAPTVELLIIARAIQGVGAALLIPCSLAIIGAAFGEKERGAAIGIWSGASAIAAGSSPLLGGWLVDHVSWRAIFLINPVIALPTILIALRHVPESIDVEAKKGLDGLGAALAFFGLGSLVYGLIAASERGWSSSIVLGAILLGLVLLIAFVAAERRSPTPMMPLNVFQSLTFSGVNILTLLLYGALGGMMFFLPFLLIQVHGYTATEAGAAFMPFTIILGVLSKWGGGLIDRFGARLPLIVGPTIVAIGVALIAAPSTDGSYWTTFFSPMVVLGFGMAVTVAPLTTTVLNSVAQHQTGVASGINNAVAQVASLLMIAILGTVGIATLNHALDRNLEGASADVRKIGNMARHGFILPAVPPGTVQQTQDAAHAVVVNSFLDTIWRVMMINAALCLASAAAAALTIKKGARVSTPSPPSD